MIKIDKKKLHNLKMWRARRRYFIAFYAFAFLLLLIVMLTLFILVKIGIPVKQTGSPILVTLITGFACAILGHGISYILMKDVFTPLEDLSKASQKIAVGEYDTQIDYQ